MMAYDKGKFWPGVKSCGGNITLKINEACLSVTSVSSSPLEILRRNVECYECDFQRHGIVQSNSTRVFLIDSTYAQELRIGVNCSKIFFFEDFGFYNWTVGLQDDTCSGIDVDKLPEKFWFNIGAITALCISLLLLYRLGCYIKGTQWFRRLIFGNVPTQELEQLLGDPGTRSRNLARTKRLSRVASIDVFRGLSVLLMVFVNFGGGRYAVFKHAPWNGMTIADVVFPFFIWVMGLSLVLSLRSQMRATISRKDIFLKILRRSVILVCIGIVLNSGKSKGDKDTQLRIPGVLQRIGITYFIVAAIEIFFGRPQRSEQFGPWHICDEMTESVAQWGIVAVLVTTHTLLTMLLPVPGCPTGYLGPGGLAQHSAYVNCTGGAAGYIDRMIFTQEHIYQHSTSAKVFQSIVPFDPEGLLGVLTSVLMASFGGHCGRIILCYEQTSPRIKRWLLWALITGISAGFLCNWSKESGWIPVNKNLWSLSYVLATSSMAFLLFTFLYWIVDHLKISIPLVYAGMNPLVVYVGHEILNKQLPWRWTPLTSTHLELLFMDVAATFMWHVISFVLYKNNVFLSL